MANTTWKQVVYDVADAYREANGTADKVLVGQLASKIREGAGENLDYELNELDSTLQQVLDILPFKGFQNSGQYVWKKYEEVTKTVTNPSITLTKGANSTTLVESSDVDLSKVTEEFFGGFIFTGGGSWYFVYENNTLYYNAGSSRYPMTYDPTTQILTGYSDEGVFMYTGDKEAHTVEVVGYAVSSDIDAYPNGGMQDGYWYELVEEVLSGIDYGEFTSTTKDPVTVAHNLKVKPNIVILFPIAVGNGTYSEYIMYRKEDYYEGTLTELWLGYGNSTSSISAQRNTDSGTRRVTSTDKDISFDPNQSNARFTGIYGWIAKA